jgi:ferredoxin
MALAAMGVSVQPSNFYAQIDPNRCKGALECIKKCPCNAIRFDKKTKTAIIDIEKCIGCGICVESCPNHAPALKKRERVIIYPETEDDLGLIRAHQGHGSKEFYADYTKSES